ncbi:MAG TPA: ABC transporter ATP-binding protein, partial [Anaerolineae bacterium]|nr:ABC transporter ATP-binding protein [Anaerolineae bacterium]
HSHPLIRSNPIGDDVVEAEGLGKSFGDFVAVRDVSLRVAAGEVLALLGPNGAGKTTTVRMLSGILVPTTGWARIAGLDVTKNSEEIRQRVGVLAEMPGLYLRSTAREYLEFFGSVYGLPQAQTRSRINALMAKFEMSDVLNRRLSEFSKGMKQKLALIRSMLHDPDVLLLDEPTSAMDPQSARVVRDSLQQLRDDRRSIILCTHNLVEAESMADHIAIIRRGRIVIEGSPLELKTRLLGQPLMELRFARSLNGMLPALQTRLKVESCGDDWLRYWSADPAADNPPLLRWLASEQIDVVTLSEVPRSLEEVYLRVVGQPIEAER